jgi:hypothetical protein
MLDPPRRGLDVRGSNRVGKEVPPPSKTAEAKDARSSIGLPEDGRARRELELDEFSTLSVQQLSKFS